MGNVPHWAGVEASGFPVEDCHAVPGNITLAFLSPFEPFSSKRWAEKPSRLPAGTQGNLKPVPWQVPKGQGKSSLARCRGVFETLRRPESSFPTGSEILLTERRWLGRQMRTPVRGTFGLLLQLGLLKRA